MELKWWVEASDVFVNRIISITCTLNDRKVIAWIQKIGEKTNI